VAQLHDRYMMMMMKTEYFFRNKYVRKKQMFSLIITVIQIIIIHRPVTDCGVTEELGYHFETQ